MIDQLASRVRKLESAEDPVVFNSVAAAVSTPPTQVEIDTAFGATAAQIRDGWSGLIYDAATGTVWVCMSESDLWWIIGITAFGFITVTTRVIPAMSPYTPPLTDEIIYCDTDAGAIIINLPAGVNGKHYKIINCGSSANNVTVNGNGVETVFGAAAQILFDAEVIDLHFEPTEYWW